MVIYVKHSMGAWHLNVEKLTFRAKLRASSITNRGHRVLAASGPQYIGLFRKICREVPKKCWRSVAPGVVGFKFPTYRAAHAHYSLTGRRSCGLVLSLTWRERGGEATVQMSWAFRHCGLKAVAAVPRGFTSFNQLRIFIRNTHWDVAWVVR